MKASAESLGGFCGKLADPVVARMYQRDMDSNLANLKLTLEVAKGAVRKRVDLGVLIEPEPVGAWCFWGAPGPLPCLQA